MIVDYAGAVSVCAYSGGQNGCNNIRVTNNIAASSVYCGFCTIGLDCGGSSSMVFSNNVAHSIKGQKSGHGLVVGTNPGRSNQKVCYQASDFAAYKCQQMGAIGFTNSDKVYFTRMTMIDNLLGFGVNAVPGTVTEYDEHIMQLDDNVIYGETISPDCP
jgi:hypothetical protein